VGDHAMIGADCKITKDILPYALVGRDPSKIEGVNKIGLRRRGFSDEMIEEISSFYSSVFFSGFNTSDGIDAYTQKNEHIIPEVQVCLDFIKQSKKGIVR
jgi:UDP-N-acetylglucosamine acyltransferase